MMSHEVDYYCARADMLFCRFAPAPAQSPPFRADMRQRRRFSFTLVAASALTPRQRQTFAAAAPRRLRLRCSRRQRDFAAAGAV
jgi:hypothetical protein